MGQALKAKYAVKKGELPNSVEVVGKHYALELLDMEIAGGDMAGATDVIHQVLRIGTNQAFHAERDTVLHELLHAIDYGNHTGIKEYQIHSMANALLQVLRRNPELVSYLTKPFPLD